MPGVTTSAEIREKNCGESFWGFYWWFELWRVDLEEFGFIYLIDVLTPEVPIPCLGKVFILDQSRIQLRTAHQLEHHWSMNFFSPTLSHKARIQPGIEPVTSEGDNGYMVTCLQTTFIDSHTVKNWVRHNVPNQHLASSHGLLPCLRNLTPIYLKWLIFLPPLLSV